MSEAPAPFSSLEWDSAFFGKRIARVADGQHSLAELEACTQLARSQGVDCLYLLLDPAHAGAGEAASRAGFRLVDVRLTLEGPARRTQSLPAGVRAATAGDLLELRGIASRSHHDSRFYADPHFDRERCDELFATWIERCVEGALADVVLVTESPSGVAGYVTCRKVADGIGNIGLFAVAEAERGRGHGSRLLDAALTWFANNDLARVNVVTQGRNAAAQRIYQRAGFHTVDTRHWYHFWSADADVSS